MNSITKISTFGIPALIGMTAAWMATKIIKNEKKLAARKIELELQL
tara:strand:- start:172 stop:309 length:138 start_codon:yes stop_codon:yes gene_type:complete